MSCRLSNKRLINANIFLKNNMTWCEAYNCSNYSKNNPEKTLEKEKFNNRGRCAKYLVEYKEQKYWDQFYEITLFRSSH